MPRFGLAIWPMDVRSITVEAAASQPVGVSPQHYRGGRSHGHGEIRQGARGAFPRFGKHMAAPRLERTKVARAEVCGRGLQRSMVATVVWRAKVAGGTTVVQGTKVARPATVVHNTKVAWGFVR